MAVLAVAKNRNGIKAEDARASTTDAGACMTMMGEGGFRPAFNVQFTTMCHEQVIVSMEVVNADSDMTKLGTWLNRSSNACDTAPMSG